MSISVIFFALSSLKLNTKPSTSSDAKMHQKNFYGLKFLSLQQELDLFLISIWGDQILRANSGYE